eukprot:4192901-Prymnesium_polylepis.2
MAAAALQELGAARALFAECGRMYRRTPPSGAARKLFAEGRAYWCVSASPSGLDSPRALFVECGRA